MSTSRDSKDIEAYLARQAVPDLVHIIMEQTNLDDEFYAMLQLRAATDAAKPNTSEMKRVLRQAIGINDFVSWKETYGYTHGVDRVLGQLRTMLTPEHAAEVIDLAEYALDLWEESIESIDDSDGCMGMIRDAIHQLHLEACEIARPNPVELAERLCRRAISSEWEMFYDSYQTYADVFGHAGRARYRKIVQNEWDALPHIGPGDEDPDRYGRASTLEHMMLAFAEEDDDLDTAIRVLSRDLSHSYCYLRIAERCREAQQYTLAREWAEKGMAAFADKPDPRLRGFLSDEYLRAKRPDDAIAMLWANYKGRSALETYQALATCARKLECWDAWREKAFTLMRNEITDRKTEFEREYGDGPTGQRPMQRWIPQPDHSLLVQILLWEEREEEAWAEAQEGGCSEGYWLRLAELREKRHPEDAIEIYRRQIEPLINETNNHSYEQAVEFLDRIHRLMTKTGKEEDFRSELSRLKTEYRRKRNFIKYVEGRAWGR